MGMNEAVMLDSCEELSGTGNATQDLQFYPTPPALAAKAWAKFQNRDFERVLEPSAGEGHLIRSAPSFGYYRSLKIDAIEIDLHKHAALRDDGVSIVALDFLKFKGGAQYSHTIMNPPFAQGARHVLHAWNIMWDGEIVAILNAETIRNPFSSDRQQLVALIEQHGEVEYVGQAFVDSERSTNVDVALVWLRKKADATGLLGCWWEDLKQDQPRGRFEYAELQELALPNSFVENAVAAFNAAEKMTREAIHAEARANHYSRMLGKTLAEYDGGGSQSEADISTSFVRNTYRKEYDKLKDRAWAGVLRSTEVTSRTSSKVQKQIESEFENVKTLEFTVENVYGFLLGLVENKGSIQKDMACEVFDLITKYHSDNTVFYKGWKSNDRHRSAGMRIKTTRFILPGFRLEKWSRSFGHYELQNLADIDKVFAMLDGRHEPDVSLVWLFHNKIDALRGGARLSSSYFDVRFYPGIGTIHFFPKAKNLVDRLNRFVGKIRKWIPPEESMASDAYWKQYEKAEKFDKEIRAEISRGSGRDYWNNPLRRMFSHTDSERDSAMQRIDEAVQTVLEAHGINVDAMLAPVTQLPLLAAA